MGFRLFSGVKWLIALSLLLFGLIVSVQSQDQDFVATTATIMESGKSYKSKGSPDRLPALFMHFNYRYRFQEKEYHSSRVRHGFLNKAAGVAQFPVGSKITIYVNPDNPEYAVIHRGFPTAFYMVILAGAVMLTNMLLDTSLQLFDKKNRRRPKWLQSAFNLSGPMIAVTFFSAAIMLFF